MHSRKVDASGKNAKTLKKRSTIEEKSVHNEDFYIDFRELGSTLNEDEVFKEINHPAEALGLISVITGNDKNPGFRSCTKKHAIITYKEFVKDGNMKDLVGESAQFRNNSESQLMYHKFVAAMYFRLYRVEIRSLGLDWESFATEDSVNLQLLREVGMRKFKGKAYMYVPMPGVLSAAFKRVIYQIMEYDQIFESIPEYPDPTEFGFSEIGEGVLTPTLNQDFEEGATFYTVMESAIKDGDEVDIE
eukprot:gene2589-3000_t